jgi:V/A-type H+-transporting ATPase subunit C
LQSLEQFLLESHYGESLRLKLVTSRGGPLRRIEAAIAHEVNLQLRFVQEKAEGEAKELLGVVLARSDLMNGRILLRALHTGSKNGEEPQWHNYGNLTEGFYSDLWKNTKTATDIIEGCRALGHPYALAIAASFAELDQSGNLVRAERMLLLSMLDLFWKKVGQFDSGNSRLLQEYLERSIDMWNLGIWLRQRYGQVPTVEATKMYLQNGRWIFIEKLSKTTILSEVVQGTPWQGIIKPIENNKPQEFQRALFVQFMKWQSDLFRADPLGVAVGLGFIAKYLIEWQNLSLLAVGLSLGLSEKELESRLIPIQFLPLLLKE